MINLNKQNTDRSKINFTNYKILFNKNIKIEVFKTYDDLSYAASSLFIKLNDSKIKTTFIVPGGSTPQLFYELLFDRVYDWSNTNLILSDERQVKLDHEKSNEGFLKNISSKLKSQSTQPYIYPFAKNNYPLEKIPSSVEKEAARLTPITAAFLGLGTDGHTASIFSLDQKIFNSDHFFSIVQNKQEPLKELQLIPEYYVLQVK